MEYNENEDASFDSGLLALPKLATIEKIKVEKRKPGPRRRKPEAEKSKNITITISPEAYEVYLKLQTPSRRISDFLLKIRREVEIETETKPTE